MLEDKLAGTKIGRKWNELTPSSNQIFQTGNTLDTLSNKAHKKFLSKYTKWLQGKELGTWGEAAAQLPPLMSKAATKGTYLATETAGRLSEGALRGTLKVAGILSKKAYEFGKKKSNADISDKLERIEESTTRLKERAQSELNKKPNLKRKAKTTKDYATVLTSIVLMYSIATGNPERQTTEPASNPRIEQTSDNLITEPIPLEDISNFQNIEDILVYTANEAERTYVIDNLEYWNDLRSPNQRMQFRNGPGGTDKIIDGDIEMDIVIQGEEEIPDDAYDMIQLRGHVWDMSPLYSDAIESRGDKTFVYLGGCDSDDFIGERAREDIAIMGGIGTQDGSNNTHMLLQIPDALDRSNSWREFRQEISELNSHVGNTFVFPGSDRYTRERERTMFEQIGDYFNRNF